MYESLTIATTTTNTDVTAVSVCDTKYASEIKWDRTSDPIPFALTIRVNDVNHVGQTNCVKTILFQCTCDDATSTNGTRELRNNLMGRGVMYAVTYLQIVDRLLSNHTNRPNFACPCNGRPAINYRLGHSSFEHLDYDKAVPLHTDWPYLNWSLKHLEN